MFGDLLRETSSGYRAHEIEKLELEFKNNYLHLFLDEAKDGVYTLEVTDVEPEHQDLIDWLHRSNIQDVVRMFKRNRMELVKSGVGSLSYTISWQEE